MSKLITSACLWGVVNLTSMWAAPIYAAELRVPPPAHVGQAAECGPCGCVHVTYDYHRELRSTYGVSFDPRNFDQTQPYYYFGPVRAYPRFWCDANAIQ
jgi:hypothetical protein